MHKKEVVAMVLAGGRGSRLGILTDKTAKPAVSFGGKYRIIDFTLSNCINSGIDTVGVLTQYQPLQLNRHIGIGIPWDLDKSIGGITVLSPYLSRENEAWYSGTANAIFQNIPFIDYYDPEYVLVLSGDHIYKMDYEMMLNNHKLTGADISIAVLPVPYEQAHQFGIMNTDDQHRIIEFEEKPENPKNNLASMGIYIFNWKVLRNALKRAEKNHNNSDFGKHIIPFCLKQEYQVVAYEFEGFWRDVGTLESYWKTNMELISLVPEFNLYEAYWKIYTNNEIQPPQYIADTANVDRCILGEGTEIYGSIFNCVIGSNVTIEKGCMIKDSIIMSNTTIRENTRIERGVISEDVIIGKNVTIGEGENTVNALDPQIYYSGITVVGEDATIPDNVWIGKNCTISGKTTINDYRQQRLESGNSILLEEVDI
ncbi:glucose-1-phosphate adenylyltransferase [Vallitaleaceae bacterium 9-2]